MNEILSALPLRDTAGDHYQRRHQYGAHTWCSAPGLLVELHPIAKMTMAAESGRCGELFQEHAPVGDNDALRRRRYHGAS